MPEKWTEIDGEKERKKEREKDGEGEERGIAGIPARTGHTQETGNREQKIPRSTGERGIFLFDICHLTFDICYLTSSKSTSSAVG